MGGRGAKRYGQAKWTDFTMKTQVYETTGKDYLLNWNNVKGWMKTGYGNVRAITEDTFKNAR